MTWKHWIPYALVLLALWIVAATYTSYGAAKERAQQSARSLAASRDTLTAFRDSLTHERARVAATIIRVDTLWRVRTQYLARADSFARRADSIVALLPASPEACRPIVEAYTARTTECAVLRLAVQADSEAIRRGQAQLVEVEQTLTAATTTVTSLNHTLAEIRKPYTCRILFVPCPSRTVTFFLGALSIEALRIGLHKP